MTDTRALREERAASRCADCGSGNPDLIDYAGDGRLVCRHRYACEARLMLKAGASSKQAAEHAQKRRPW